MKNILLSILLFAIGLSAQSQKMKPQKWEYDTGVDYSVIKILRPKMAEYGDGGDHKMYFAKSGYRFVKVLMEFTNNNKEDIIIDFDQMFLMDKNDVKYHCDAVMQNNSIGTTAEKYKLKLKAGKTRQFAVDFWATLPKEEIIGKMAVDGDIITFEPQD